MKLREKKLYKKIYFFLYRIFAFVAYKLEPCLFRKIDRFIIIPKPSFLFRYLPIFQSLHIDVSQIDKNTKEIIIEMLEDDINSLLRLGYRAFRFKTHSIILTYIPKILGMSRKELNLLKGGKIGPFRTEKYGILLFEIKKSRRRSFVPEKNLFSKNPNFNRAHPVYKVKVLVNYKL